MADEKKQYPKVQFMDNVPVTLTFAFDKPKTGQGVSKTGEKYTWYLYACNEGGVDKSFFATELQHKTLMLAKIGKGTTATICIKQRTDDKKKKFWEVQTNGHTYTSDMLSEARLEEEVKTEVKVDGDNKAFYGTVENLRKLYNHIYHLESAEVGAMDVAQSTATIYIQSCRSNATPPKELFEPAPVDEVPPPSDGDAPNLPF